MKNKKKELSKFLDELRLGDIIFELEELKSEDLTETEKAGAVLLFLAELHEREKLIQALKNDDIEYVKEILISEVSQIKYIENKNIKFNAEDSEKILEDVIELIFTVGTYNLRMSLDLITDEDINELENNEK